MKKKKATEEKQSNPIVGEYRGVKIRQYPQLRIRVSIYEFKRFIDARKDFELTEKEAILSGKVLCREIPVPTVKSLRK